MKKAIMVFLLCIFSLSLNASITQFWPDIACNDTSLTLPFHLN